MSLVIPSLELKNDLNNEDKHKTQNPELESLKNHCWYDYDFLGCFNLYIRHCKYMDFDNLTCRADEDNRKCIDLIEFENSEVKLFKRKLFRKPIEILSQKNFIKDCQYARFIIKEM